MGYTQLFSQLKTLFAEAGSSDVIKGDGFAFHQMDFKSDYNSPLAGELPLFNENAGIACKPDNEISENLHFRYPVLMPAGNKKPGKAIILLHGLNERSWTKYLAWAYYLFGKTGRPVILFPIAFHMNRSPEAWSDPRQMAGVLARRRQASPDNTMASIANIALSERLSQDPLRFFTSGQQSAHDLFRLIRQLADGSHPLFGKGTSVDVFAYSIGAFLAQIMFLADPEKLLGNSRLFLFCGGAMFDQMQGTSKLIMDGDAFRSLRRYYFNEFITDQQKSEALNRMVNQTPLGQAFQAMLALDQQKPFRESRYASMRDRLQAVALRTDSVIPAVPISQVLEKNIDLEVMDFPFPYSHEAPFPVLSGESASLVDQSFETVFNKAAVFLA